MNDTTTRVPTEYTPLEQLTYEQAFRRAGSQRGCPGIWAAPAGGDLAPVRARPGAGALLRQPAGPGGTEAPAPHRRDAGGFHASGVSVMVMQGVLSNTILIAAVLAWAIAQTIKVPVYYLQRQRWNWAILLSPGGMPSSHTALVTAAAHAIGLFAGFDHASLRPGGGCRHCGGLRRYRYPPPGGVPGGADQPMIRDLASGHPLKSEKLREVLGHTPLEALGGVSPGARDCPGGLAPGGLNAASQPSPDGSSPARPPLPLSSATSAARTFRIPAPIRRRRQTHAGRPAA